MAPGLLARSDIVETHQGYIPNPDRSPNPFTRSSEPDWVVVGSLSNGTADRQSGGHDRQATNQSSKDMGAYNIKDQPLSEYIHVDGAEAAANGAPVARIDSLASSTSLLTGVRRKPAPPVPKKPLLLISNSKQVPPQSAIAPALGTVRRSEATSNFQSWGKSVYADSLPTQRRSTSIDRQASRRQGPVPAQPHFADEAFHDGTHTARRPPLPARPEDQTTTGTGLMDDDSNDDQVRSIPSLQPVLPK